MTPIRRCIPESTDNRLRDLYRCGSLGMFLSLLYERKCLGIDLIKINCCLNVPIIIWPLYVLNSVTSELQYGSCRVFIALAERMSYFFKCAFSWHFKQKCFALFNTGCFGHRSGAIWRHFWVYIGQTEWSARFVYKLFLFGDRSLVFKRGYVKIHVARCLFHSRTGLLILFLLAATYIWGIQENKYELWWYLKCNKNVRKSPTSRTTNFELRVSYSLPIGLKTISYCHSSHMRTIVTQSL